MTSVLFSREHPKVLKMIILKALAAFHWKKLLSLQQETRPYVNGFPLGCCDHSSLMERDPNYMWHARFLIMRRRILFAGGCNDCVTNTRISIADLSCNGILSGNPVWHQSSTSCWWNWCNPRGSQGEGMWSQSAGRHSWSTAWHHGACICPRFPKSWGCCLNPKP